MASLRSGPRSEAAPEAKYMSLSVWWGEGAVIPPVWSGAWERSIFKKIITEMSDKGWEERWIVDTRGTITSGRPIWGQGHVPPLLQLAVHFYRNDN